MSAVSFHVTPGYGELALTSLGYSQAVRVGDRAPVWTQTGVTVLGLPEMRIEIRVTAIAGDDAEPVL